MFHLANIHELTQKKIGHMTSIILENGTRINGRLGSELITGDTGDTERGWDVRVVPKNDYHNILECTIYGDFTRLESRCGKAGIKSQERYSGQLLRDCLHGLGEYTYRYRGNDALGIAYEGHYFNNYKYGYGVTSYANGCVFRGLYHSNFRWGPGVESNVNVSESVGLWRGRQLMRLTWKPSGPSVSPDLMSSPIGSSIVSTHRTVLVTNTRIIGQVNPALELLKQYGAPPLAAAQNWIKLYPKNCTDNNSQLYHADLFERTYYKNNKIVTLEEQAKIKDESEDGTSSPVVHPERFYAWNNNEMIIHMMKHCYLHEEQRKGAGINLKEILNGPRSSFKPPAQNELDCRTILVASYLGHIRHIAQFINEYDVNPNVTDMAGNSAIMYAACGNQPEVIHFLVEAGARIDDYNDACCTPLGVVLLNYACARRDIPLSKIIQAILPSPGVAAPLPVGTDDVVSEWQIKRDSSSVTTNILQKTASNRTLKSIQGTVGKKPSILMTKKIDTTLPKDSKLEETTKKKETAESVAFSEDKRLYYNLVNEYNIRVNAQMMQSSGMSLVPYIFEINDMVKEIDAAEADEQKKVLDKKDTNKIGRPSKMYMSSSTQQDLHTEASELEKEYRINTMFGTIEQLLLNGADPRRVNCPQPALFIAIASYCPDLVQLMIKHGADPNKEYPQTLGYTLLDIAVSGPMMDKNLQIIQTLLENGAKADHRLPIIDSVAVDPDQETVPGPTLLHAVLAKRNFDPEGNDDIREQILELLLKYGSDPTALYNGRSAMDIATSRSLGIFDIFIESPNTDLNAIINSSNQTVLVKMFYLPFCKTISIAQRLQMVTNLLLYGADPLLKCQNGDERYKNLFVYTKKVMSDYTKSKPVPTGSNTNPKKVKSETKPKKSEKAEKLDKSKIAVQSVAKSLGKIGGSGEDSSDYKQAVSVVTNCARLLYIRWLQAKLMKELVEIVDKFKHRHWNMILKEYDNGTRCGLWLNAVRCLEIWDILKTTKRRVYNDKRVLKYILCIVHYHFTKRVKILREHQISSKAKTAIELEVAYFIREHSSPTPPVSTRPYVMPELAPDNEVSKFNICFECGLPLEDAKIPCDLCKLIDFCSFECMEINIERFNCHPCSNYLRNKYFPTPAASEDEVAKASV